MKENQLLDALTREGVLINVSVKYWRATKRLTAEDLGLDPANVESRLISLGHKKLIPKEGLKAFALIESRAHSLVEACSFPFLNGLAHFLPNTKLEEVMAGLARLENEFHEERIRFMSRYSEMRQSAADEWWDLAQKLVPEPEKLVARIAESFPCPERMEQFFGFATQLFQITIPEGLGVNAVTAGDQETVREARETAARQAADKITQGVEGFVTDCVASLRQQTARLCEDMLDSMRSGKTGVHQKTLNRLVNFIDQFKSLNFMGDGQLEAALDRVRQEFLSTTAEEYRDSNYAKARLEQGLQGLAEKARDMAKQDSRELVERFGQLGVRRFHVDSPAEDHAPALSQSKVA